MQYKDMLIKHHPNNERVYAAPSHKKSIKTHMISQQAEQVASTHHSLPFLPIADALRDKASMSLIRRAFIWEI